MKGHKIGILLVFVLLIGVCILLYPSVSQYWNSKTQTRAVENYQEILNSLQKEDYEAFFQEAERYNDALAQLNFPLTDYVQLDGYNDVLNISGNGVMGYVSIEKIGVRLPICHGTDEAVLQIAVGHVEGSSLPTGGAGTHCVLSGHRGLPSARLFTDLDKLEVGDVFTLTVIDLTMTYQVDQILVVEPDDVEPLYTVAGEDYCTLVTCTPYGINSHRLLVRGTRIENEKELADIRVTADAALIEPVLVVTFVAAPILLVLFLYLVLPRKKQENEP